MARLKPLVLVALLIAAFSLSRHYGLGEPRNLARIRALVEAQGAWAPLAFIGVCVAGIFLHVPEFLLIAVGGVVFEGRRAFAYGWVASLVGSTSTFLVVRYFAHDFFQQRLEARLQWLRALDERLVANGFWTVLSLRLLLFLAPPLNWALGATRVRTAHYVAGTALGVVPGIATTVFFADAIVGNRGGAPLLLPLVGIAVAVAIGVRGRRRGRRATSYQRSGSNIRS